MINKSIYPPIQFTVDSKTSTGAPTSLQKFVEEEPDYDVAFTEAFLFGWDTTNVEDAQELDTVDGMLSLLDRIQAISLSHMEEKTVIEKVVGDSITCVTKPGRTESEGNGCCFQAGLNCNEEGVKELIQDICLNKEPFVLTVKNPTTKITKKIDTQRIAFYNNGSLCCFLPLNEQNIDVISQNIQGHAFILSNTTKPEIREFHAKNKITQYFTNISKAKGDLTKIDVIVRLIQDLTRLHLFYDANGRNLYILANLLMHKNKLTPFYPENMCMFEANSRKTMTDLVVKGQTLFSSRFGDIDALVTGLRHYDRVIKEIKTNLLPPAPDYPGVQKGFKTRDFELLYRNTAHHLPLFELFKYLLDNAEHLHLNIEAEGKTCGNAEKIAKKVKNEKALQAIREHRAQNSSSTATT